MKKMSLDSLNSYSYIVMYFLEMKPFRIFFVCNVKSCIVRKIIII